MQSNIAHINYANNHYIMWKHFVLQQNKGVIAQAITKRNLRRNDGHVILL